MANNFVNILVGLLVLWKSCSGNDESDDYYENPLSLQPENWRIPAEILFENIPKHYQPNKNIPLWLQPNSNENGANRDYGDDEELDISQPYGIQNRDVPIERETRTRITNGKHEHPSFQSICPSYHTPVDLEKIYPGYEYRPRHYGHVTCHHSYSVARPTEYLRDHNKVEAVCSVSGYCIQMNQKLYLARRRYGSSCWETLPAVTVNSSCDCMWPKHHNDNIANQN